MVILRMCRRPRCVRIRSDNLRVCALHQAQLKRSMAFPVGSVQTTPTPLVRLDLPQVLGRCSGLRGFPRPVAEFARLNWPTSLI
jgi:hypothetical protein